MVSAYIGHRIYIIVLMILCVSSSCWAVELEGNLVKCDQEDGTEIMIDIVKDNPCIRCFCREGFVDCVYRECAPVDGCHNIVLPPPMNSCCQDICQACMYNNMSIPSGQTIPDTSDPCITLQCHGGVLTRSKDICHIPCKNPVIIPGQCCPVCQGCTYKDKIYTDGLQFNDNKDPCVKCQCLNGNIECKKRSCPQLNCPAKFLRNPESGKCCPTCTGQRQLFQLFSKCIYHPHNKVYSDGEAIRGDTCQSCVCRKGTVICSKKTCPRLKCREDERLPPAEGECCYSCPQSKKKCKVDGKKIKHGRSWFKNQCTECFCKDGVTHCMREDCSSIIDNCPTGTHELQYVGGLCCPQCVEISATCFVFGDPHYRTFDGLLYTFQGTCQYTLAQQCSKRQRTFSIQVKNSAWPDKTQYAYTDSVLITTKLLQVELKQRLRVYVNKTEVDLPYIRLGHMSIIQRGYSLVVTTSLGVTVTWDGLSYLEVDIPQRYKDKMCGLCGNYNGISEDDFTGRHKTSYTNAIDFANSWHRGPSTCELTSSYYKNIPVPSFSCRNRDRETMSWINSQCEVLTDYMKTSKCKVMGRDAVEYQDQCIDKLCECYDPVFCYCQSATALLKACKAGDLQSKFRRSIAESCAA